MVIIIFEALFKFQDQSFKVDSHFPEQKSGFLGLEMAVGGQERRSLRACDYVYENHLYLRFHYN